MAMHVDRWLSTTRFVEINMWLSETIVDDDLPLMQFCANNQYRLRFAGIARIIADLSRS
jgi:hypothetical protein